MPPLICDAADISSLFEIPSEHAGVAATEIEPVRWHCEIQGRVVRFYRTGCKVPPHPDRCRDAVGPWSEQSRIRLLRYLNRINYPWLGPSSFVTLTYPDDWWSMEYTKRTDVRNAFHQTMERYIGRHFASIWRQEWEERKQGKYTGKLAPHLHLMCCDVPFIPWQEVREAWRRALGYGDGPLSTHVRQIRGVEGVGKYLAKYVSKYRSLDIATYVNSGIKFGRHWGIRRPELVPLSPVVVSRPLTEKEKDRVQAFACARWSWYDRDTCGGFTLLGNDFSKGFAAWLSRGGQSK